MNKFLEVLTDPLVKRLDHRTAGAALAFWAAGLLLFAFTSGQDDLSCTAGPDGTSGWCGVVRLGGTGAAVLVIAALAVLTGSSALVSGMTPRALQFLAGVGWPVDGVLGGFCKPLRRLAIQQQLARRDRALTAEHIEPDIDDPLQHKSRSTIRRANVERAISAAVDVLATGRLRRFPLGPDAFLAPTRIGNALAATDERIRCRHGIDLGLCWELLLANLPNTAHQRLAQESARLTARGQSLVFAVLAFCWIGLLLPNVLTAAVWTALVAILVAAAYVGVCEALESYCDLIEATLITHRHRVYHAVGVALPEHSLDEPATGAALMRYLAELETPDLQITLGRAESPDEATGTGQP